MRDLCFSPDGSVLASGSDDETLKLWNLWTGEEIKEFIGHDNAITSVDYASNGAYVLTARCVLCISLCPPAPDVCTRVCLTACACVSFTHALSLSRARALSL